ncbi:MAG: VWA domain-containing protein [Vicinamibacterales bacterium]
MIVPPPTDKRFAACLCLLLAGLAGVPATAQFQAGVDLVEVYATVTDTQGNPIRGLTADDFGVSEDGVGQEVSAFAEGEVPLAVAVAVDHSFSVPRNQLTQYAAAAQRFLKALRPADEVMVIGVGSETATLSALSSSRGPAIAALDSLQPWGTTPLYDAVVEAVAGIDSASGRRALVLLSDGVERYSEITGANMIAEARRRNVLVYPVILGSTASADLREVARVTGGRFVSVRSAERLTAELEGIATELRAQYLLGYSSKAMPLDVPTWRSIRVTVDRTGAVVRAREGYVAR